MLNKIEKLEMFINSFLGKVFSFVWKSLRKLSLSIIPQLFFTKTNQAKLSLKTKKTLLIQKIKFFCKKVLTVIKNLKRALFSSIDKIQAFPVKEETFKKIKSTKEFILTTNIKVFLKEKLSSTQKKIRSRISSLHFLKQSNLKLLILTLAPMLFGVYTMYIGFDNILKQQSPSRKPASIQEYDYRPDYKFYVEKTITVLNMKVPIFTEDVTQISSITIDFSLRLSTRFAKYYITEFEYRLKDYFFTNVEAVISNFPIEREGKEILKEKIKIEIDRFLLENNVEGNVEDVNILYIIGS